MDLVRGIEAGELVMEYQAIVDVTTGVPLTMEALVRWHHHRLGRLLPIDFLHLADHDGVSRVLTSAVLERAIADCRAWQQAGLPVGVSVNVDPLVLGGVWLADLISGLLARFELPAADVTIEITERRSDPRLRGIRDSLQTLADVGLRVSLDDFGTGESSLSRLRCLQFDEIKIDGGFVSAVAAETADRSIVRFATALAHELGARVVAEGVEEVAVMEVLADLEVDAAQGFFLHRPRQWDPGDLALAPIGGENHLR